MVPSGGSFERYLSDILREHEKCDCIDDIEKSLCKILASSVEAIPHLLNRNSGYKQRLPDVAFAKSSISTDINLDALTIDCKTFSKMYFEPFHVKCELYVTLIEFVIQLVKIQYIIPVTRKTLVDHTLSDDEE